MRVFGDGRSHAHRLSPAPRCARHRTLHGLRIVLRVLALRNTRVAQQRHQHRSPKRRAIRSGHRIKRIKADKINRIGRRRTKDSGTRMFSRVSDVAISTCNAAFAAPRTRVVHTLAFIVYYVARGCALSFTHVLCTRVRAAASRCVLRLSAALSRAALRFISFVRCTCAAAAFCCGCSNARGTPRFRALLLRRISHRITSGARRVARCAAAHRTPGIFCLPALCVPSSVNEWNMFSRALQNNNCVNARCARVAASRVARICARIAITLLLHVSAQASRLSAVDIAQIARAYLHNALAHLRTRDAVRTLCGGARHNARRARAQTASD